MISPYLLISNGDRVVPGGSEERIETRMLGFLKLGGLDTCTPWHCSPTQVYLFAKNAQVARRRPL